MKEERIPVFVNPMRFNDLDIALITAKNKKTITSEQFLGYLCDPGSLTSPDDLFERYEVLSEFTSNFVIVPHEEHLLKKIIWPIRQAKTSFIIGNYLSTIALCGLVAEMAAIFIFDLSCIYKEIDIFDKKRNLIDGIKFEKKGQKERINILYKNNLLSDKVNSKFHKIRQIRKNYLHYWSNDHKNLTEDALRCFESAVGIVLKVLKTSIKDGKLILPPEIIQYLKQNIHSQI